MLTHFHRAWEYSRKPINVLRDEKVTEDPTGAKNAEEAPGLPAESEAPGTKNNSKYRSLYQKNEYLTNSLTLYIKTVNVVCKK
ncbi:hypothetical protein GWK17_02340 [Bacillus selenatarsenatis]|uniref:Uncharacterized protein n=1 Tax=Mesobacillus selenatarsenatis TaxID=388741 RepID=A0A846TR14_9BACI|nr:hypothetical protein [Mesobacillus selenatarsenatis]